MLCKNTETPNKQTSDLTIIKTGWCHLTKWHFRQMCRMERVESNYKGDIGVQWETSGLDQQVESLWVKMKKECFQWISMLAPKQWHTVG